MADSRSRATTEGVAEAWDWWLSQHDVSVPELIHDAVTKAVTAWLDQHGHDLLLQMTEPSSKFRIHHPEEITNDKTTGPEEAP